LVLPIMLAMLVFGLVQIVSTAHQNSNAPLLYKTLMGDRYFLFAKVSFWICVASALSCWRPEAKCLSHGLVPILLLLVATNHPGMMRRHLLPDLHWKQAVKVLKHPDTTSPVSIPINPKPWRIVVTPSRTQ